MMWFVAKSLGILYLIKILDIVVSLISTWTYHHLYLRLERVGGVRVGHRGVGDGGPTGGHHEEDAQAIRCEDIV